MFVAKKQQIEGLTFVAKRVSMKQFSASTARLVEQKFMKRSVRYELIKKMRHIKNISWEEYKKNHEIKPKIQSGYEGLW